MNVIVYSGNDLSAKQINDLLSHEAAASGAKLSGCVVCNTPQELVSAFSRLSASQSANLERRISFRASDGGIHFLRLSEIYYFRSASHRVIVHLADGTEYSSKTLRISARTYLAPLLESGEFLQISRSSFVNLHHVRSISADAMHLSDDIVLPLSRKYYSQYASAVLFPTT